MRQQEKDYLQHLNDRLAGYIDVCDFIKTLNHFIQKFQRVRTLESENSRLQIQVREVEVVERKEKENLAIRYDAKIDEYRKQIDYLTREKARLEFRKIYNN